MGNSIWIWVVAVPVAIVFLVILLRWLHRFCLRLEAKGLLYYSKRPEGSMGPVVSELDRLIRPSIEHVEQARETMRAEADDRHGEER